MGTLRAGAILTVFLAVTVPLMVVQALLLAVGGRAALRLPHLYHGFICRLLGLRINLTGVVDPTQPALIVANHVSWLDIPVISAIAPVSFVTKREVRGWPFIGYLARLQRSLFIDRNARFHARSQAALISGRLAKGDRIVLFAEGTTGDGNRVLPFKSALLAAVGLGNGDRPQAGIPVQTLAISYTHLHGIPLGRTMRPGIAWYGDMEMTSHAWALLKAGSLDVCIRVGAPVALEEFADRKDLARRSEDEVRRHVVGILRGRPLGEAVVAAQPSDETVKAARGPSRPAGGGKTWT